MAAEHAPDVPRRCARDPDARRLQRRAGGRPGRRQLLRHAVRRCRRRRRPRSTPRARTSSVPAGATVLFAGLYWGAALDQGETLPLQCDPAPAAHRASRRPIRPRRARRGCRARAGAAYVPVNASVFDTYTEDLGCATARRRRAHALSGLRGRDLARQGRRRRHLHGRQRPGRHGRRPPRRLVARGRLPGPLAARAQPDDLRRLRAGRAGRQRPDHRERLQDAADRRGQHADRPRRLRGRPHPHRRRHQAQRHRARRRRAPGGQLLRLGDLEARHARDRRARPTTTTSSASTRRCWRCPRAWSPNGATSATIDSRHRDGPLSARASSTSAPTSTRPRWCCTRRSPTSTAATSTRATCCSTTSARPTPGRAPRTTRASTMRSRRTRRSCPGSLKIARQPRRHRRRQDRSDRRRPGRVRRRRERGALPRRRGRNGAERRRPRAQPRRRRRDRPQRVLQRALQRRRRPPAPPTGRRSSTPRMLSSKDENGIDYTSIASAPATVTVRGVPDVTIDKSHTGAFVRGQQGTFSLARQQRGRSRDLGHGRDRRHPAELASRSSARAAPTGPARSTRLRTRCTASVPTRSRVGRGLRARERRRQRARERAGHDRQHGRHRRRRRDQHVQQHATTTRSR